jgi:hypothetical protein
MDVEYFASRMATHAACIRALVEGITDEQARWKPDPTSWSILEVLCHLGDEEREDFRSRIDYTLHRPGEHWCRIDPAGWVTQRQYNQQESVGWLRALSSPAWDVIYHTSWGPIAAGDLFAAWVAHDILHMRQLVELRWALTRADLEPRNLDYAGEW